MVAKTKTSRKAKPRRAVGGSLTSGRLRKKRKARYGNSDAAKSADPRSSVVGIDQGSATAAAASGCRGSRPLGDHTAAGWAVLNELCSNVNNKKINIMQTILIIM